MIYLTLIYEFFKIGFFSFGGGYATIPFLYYISEIYNWYTLEELTKMIGLASITPGPVGINVATYAGFKTAGFLGAFVATASEMLPSLFFVFVIAKLLKKYSTNFIIRTIFLTLKPISCALLTSVAIELLKPECQNLKALVLLAILLLLSLKTKKKTIYYILISSLMGSILHLFS